jgi:hypothetical protein
VDSFGVFAWTARHTRRPRARIRGTLPHTRQEGRCRLRRLVNFDRSRYAGHGADRPGLEEVGRHIFRDLGCQAKLPKTPFVGNSVETARGVDYHVLSPMVSA